MKRKAFVILLALAMVFGLSSLALAEYNGYNNNNYYNNCPPTPDPVTTEGCGTGTIDMVQGASGVAGLITADTHSVGTVQTDTCSVTVSGSGAFGNNACSNVASVAGCGGWGGNDCVGSGGMVLGHFTNTIDATHTNSNMFVCDTTTQHVLQNSANMNASVIASASACGLPVSTVADQNQTYVQSINNAMLPNSGGGTVTSSYSGYTASTVKVGNTIP
jgi:hypothetical protein